MSEGTGKPDKISLDDILREDGAGARPKSGDDDGIIEVVGAKEPAAESEPDAGPAREAAVGDPGATEIEGMLAEALQEKDRLNDLYLRTRADLENFRRRVERDRDEERARARADVLGEILPAIDNLDRAIGQPAEAPSFREGILLIRRQLEDALRRLGLEPIEALGETFDPEYHEAVSAEPREGFAPNTIIDEIRRGYTLGGRVLRPSLVRVVVAPAGSSKPGAAGGEGAADGPDHRD